ncbi:MAG: hypothetical protein ACTSRF_16260 [Candidatus Freyarchaeota archaeon]
MDVVELLIFLLIYLLYHITTPTIWTFLWELYKAGIVVIATIAGTAFFGYVSSLRMMKKMGKEQMKQQGKALYVGVTQLV